MKRVRLAVALVLSVLFLLFLWPTPFRYVPAFGTTARVNRFNGRADILTADGWQPMKQRDAIERLGLPNP